MAITTVYYRPHAYMSGYNPIPWSFLSDQIGQLDFTYVIDLYINGATGTTYRLKQRPNPIGVGMVDVSSIVQPYLRLTDFSAEEGWSLPFRAGGESLTDVYLKVGEEYRIAAGEPLEIYDGFTQTIGEPAYFIFNAEYNYPVDVLPASLPYLESQENLASTTPYGVWVPYLMDGNGEFLKYGANSQTVAPWDHHTLTFINWNYDATDTYAGQVQSMVVNFTGTTGATGQIVYQNIQSNGGGPATSAAYTYQTPVLGYTTMTFKCGPKDIWPAGPVPASYTVQAYYKNTPTTATGPQAPASEIVTFTVKDPCENLYPQVRLSWLNALGGRDYYNFDMFYEKTTSSAEETYNQLGLRWSATTPVVLDTEPNTESNWQRGGNKSFNKTIVTTMEIQSDWLLQEQVDFLGGIPESPSVWAYISDDPTPITVSVRNLEYKYKNVRQNKLVQVALTLTETKLQTKQNL